MILLHRRKIVALEQLWLVIVRMLLYPYNRGNLIIISIAMVSNGCAACCVVIGESGGFCYIMLAFVA